MRDYNEVGGDRGTIKHRSKKGDFYSNSFSSTYAFEYMLSWTLLFWDTVGLAAIHMVAAALVERFLLVWLVLLVNSDEL